MRTRTILATVTLLFWGSVLRAETVDSLHTVSLDRVTVTSKATATTPVAYTNLSKQQLTSGYFAQDMPFVLSGTPSIVATSDAGNATGYTYIRARGTDATRINVTTNGVPMNDAESHSLYWVNTPDLVSNMSGIQIQRGAGTSTNGAGAFGGSINMTTDGTGTTPYGELSAVYGSFNTHRENVRFGTGLVGGRWALSASLSDIGSDGYMDRATSSLQSYFAQAAYYGKSTSVRVISFGGKEKTYMAWTGVSLADWTKDKSTTYNPCGEYTDDSGATRYYPDQTDNYRQLNNQIIIEQVLPRGWTLNITGHYTRGDGYYEEYKTGRKLSEYGMTSYTDASGATVKKSDLVRKKAMWNNFGGAVASASYTSERVSAAVGAAWNIYDGDHFGQVLWVKNYIGALDPQSEYYRNTTTKNDANIFAKVDWTVARGLNIYADLQYRFINHRISGRNDNYDRINSEMQALDVNRTYHFFNPKVGLFWTVDPANSLYLSAAVVSKEPTRNCFTDAKVGQDPKAENMLDVELGYKLNYGTVSAEANLYFMGYRNQLVQTGEVNEIGEALTANVPKSYRTGIELSAAYSPVEWFRFKIFGTLSRNKIVDYTEYISDYDENWDELGTQTEVSRRESDIAFSPSVIAGCSFDFAVKGFEASLATQYVSRQYLNNSSNSNLSIPRYCVSNLNLRYTLRLHSARALVFGVSVNNLFNKRYVSNGYGYSSMVGGSRYDEAYVFPQAGINALGSVTFKF